MGLIEALRKDPDSFGRVGEAGDVYKLPDAMHQRIKSIEFVRSCELWFDDLALDDELRVKEEKETTKGKKKKREEEKEEEEEEEKEGIDKVEKGEKGEKGDVSLNGKEVNGPDVELSAPEARVKEARVKLDGVETRSVMDRLYVYLLSVSEVDTLEVSHHFCHEPNRARTAPTATIATHTISLSPPLSLPLSPTACPLPR